ncbi:LAME_0H03158g1_1 [Lachancea meyersii CBS 8951]|uniref:LAME_0H03158g1_1 n=1 Tax=Lachancea meyersii CBS 8951 TaxID=1266667 RepID=A0A1G4KDY9_9SACH|nr:LAME_0H03158g1_1 [Lachancea meyersii CBS 8951]
MSAFHDYCVVCEKLIEGPSRLYCSHTCCRHDISAKRRKSEVENLVATPQLCPVDLEASCDSEDDELSEIDYTATVPTTLSSPQLTGKEPSIDGYFSLSAELFLDHTAEDNYRLWLNGQDA